MSSRRSLVSYAYVAAVGGILVVLNVLGVDDDYAHPDDVAKVLFLLTATAALTLVEVRLDRGRLTLAALPTGAAAVLLNPLDASLVGLATGLVMWRRARWQIVATTLMTSTVTAIAATLASRLAITGAMSMVERVVVLLMFDIASVLLVTIGLSARTGESLPSIAKHNFTPVLGLAYGYFTLGALLISYMLDGSPLGYLMATIVFVLAFALTDTIAGRRVRLVLESELSDADRHLFHSRAVEGVVHNLRNHMATAVGYLKEINLNRLDPIDREAVETATAAANDAVTALRGLAQGATPRVTFAKEPVDLNGLATTALGMARPRARAKEIELRTREARDDLKVRADPLLLREVLTNLINNAIDAAPFKGHVDVSTGRRGGGSPFVSVADNGPGVSDDNRHRLFEPHFTTKETGTGIGLFMSYGVVREHQGQLLYEGSRHGAVFTVVLPQHAG